MATKYKTLKKNYTTLFEEELRSYRPRRIQNQSNVVYTRAVSTGNKLAYENPKNSNHILVKITGGANNTQAMKRHFDYISRHNKIALYDKDGQPIKLTHAKNEAQFIMMTDECRGHSKKSYQIVFSAQGENHKEQIAEAILTTAQEQFKDYKFYYAIHEDTNNTHGHLVVLRNGFTDKRLEINKTKLNRLKKAYCIALNKVGIDAEFQSYSDKFGYKKASQRQKRKRVNSNRYQVIDFGQAPYRFKENGKPSFYLQLETNNGVRKTHWSWGLKDEVEAKAIKVNDIISLKKITHKKNNKKDRYQKSVWEMTKHEKNILEGKPYKIQEFGQARYKFNEKSKPSFYLIVKNDKGEQKIIWNKKLQTFIKTNHLKVNDDIELIGNNLIKTIKIPLRDKQSLFKQQLAKVRARKKEGKQQNLRQKLH